MNFFEVRRVRIRAEYAYLYPEVVPDVWMSARKVTRLVRPRGAPEPCRRVACARGRVLCEAHFEFRGGRRGRQYLTGIWMPRATMTLGLVWFA